MESIAESPIRKDLEPQREEEEEEEEEDWRRDRKLHGHFLSRKDDKLVKNICDILP